MGCGEATVGPRRGRLDRAPESSRAHVGPVVLFLSEPTLAFRMYIRSPRTEPSNAPTLPRPLPALHLLCLSLPLRPEQAPDHLRGLFQLQVRRRSGAVSRRSAGGLHHHARGPGAESAEERDLAGSGGRRRAGAPAHLRLGLLVGAPLAAGRPGDRLLVGAPGPGRFGVAAEPGVPPRPRRGRAAPAHRLSDRRRRGRLLPPRGPPRLPHPPAPRLACLTRPGPSDRRAASSDVRHYAGLAYKFNDTGWFDDRKSHIWIVDVASARATQLTSGDRGNDGDPEWSPDGTRIAFVSNRTGREPDGDDNSDVWVVPVSGGEPVRISDHPGADDSPRWSPDGRTIAFLGRNRDGDPPRIWLAPPAGGAASTLLYPADELFPGELTWAERGAALYFNAQHRGETHFYRLDRATREVRPITSGPRAVRRLSLDDAGGAIAFLSNDFTHLDELFVARRDGTGERRLTGVNDSLFATLALMPVQRMTYKGDRKSVA